MYENVKTRVIPTKIVQYILNHCINTDQKHTVFQRKLTKAIHLIKAQKGTINNKQIHNTGYK